MFEEGLRYDMVLLDKLTLEDTLRFRKFHQVNGYGFRRVTSEGRRTNIEGRHKIVCHALRPQW